MSLPSRPVGPILEALAQGKTAKEIAADQSIDPRTVSYWLRRHMTATGARTVIQAVLEYDRATRK